MEDRMGLLLVPVALALFAPPSVFSDGPAGEELRKLQGEWVVVEHLYFKFDDDDPPPRDRFTFLGDRVYIGGPCPRTFRVHIDPAAQPREITLMGPTYRRRWRDGDWS